MDKVTRTIKVCKNCKNSSFELFVEPNGSISASCDECDTIFHNIDSLPVEKKDYVYGVTQAQFKDILGRFGI